MTKFKNSQKKKKSCASRKQFQRVFHIEQKKIASKIFSEIGRKSTKIDNVFEKNENESETVTENIREKLAEWALNHNITFKAVQDLLLLIISFGFHFLPRDPRTLLSTPRKIHIENIANGEMWYSGIKYNLCKLFRPLDENMTLNLNFHFDGVQIYKSATKCFWPILSQIHGMPNVKPFVVGVWYGNGKPSCVNEYLSKFIEELNDIIENGIEINGFMLHINIRCILGDTPARCFLKGIRSFNHHAGCQRCVTRGRLLNRTMAFPNSKSVSRTDRDFREKKDTAHHIKTSLIENIKNFDMISDFPIADPLHLLDIGVMKRSLGRWLLGNKSSYRKIFKNATLIKFDRLLRIANDNRPREIHRSIRCSNTFSRWKATEFRTILLYVGLTVFKGMIPNDEYEMFVELCCAVKLCNAEFNLELDSRVDMINDLLNTYVDRYKKKYGEHTITSNIHYLCHLSADIKRFGNINSISTYPFENHLGLMNKKIRAFHHPLEQISKRLAEIDNNARHSTAVYSERNISRPSVEFSIDRDFGSFQTIICKEYQLSSRRVGDRWFLLKSSNNIVKFEKAIQRSNGTIEICGKELLEKKCFFKEPFLSEHIDIFISDCKEKNDIVCTVDDIKCKLFRLPCEGTFVFQPLLHTIT